MAFSDQDIYRVYLDNRPLIHRFLIKRVFCPDTALDLVQDIYLRLKLLEPRPDNEKEVRAWLFTVASNLSIDHLRTQKRRTDLMDRYLNEEPVVELLSVTERVAQADIQFKILQSTLAELPDQCAEILYLNRIEGLSHAEISRQLNISRSWVEKQLARALLHCRQALNNEPD